MGLQGSSFFLFFSPYLWFLGITAITIAKLEELFSIQSCLLYVTLMILINSLASCSPSFLKPQRTF